MKFFIEKINFNLFEKNSYIKKYDLKFIDVFKKYNIGNVEIISNKKCIKFYKKCIHNEKNYELINMIPFSFYNIEYEKEYKLYQKDNIILKEYDDIFELEFIDK